MRYINVNLANATNINPSFNSSAVDASLLMRASVQAVVTGTSPVGAAQMQASNDAVNPTNWANIGSSLAISATGVSFIAALELSYRWVRVAWTYTSGTGTITFNFEGVGWK